MSKKIMQSPNSPSSPSETCNFMPMHPRLLPLNQSNKVDGEAIKKYCIREIQRQNLQSFWNGQLLEMHCNEGALNVHHQLPLARIKRVMKSNKNVKMVTAETPILLSKACEMFIQELTLRSWLQTEAEKRRTLHGCDIVKAIKLGHDLDFLLDVAILENHQ